MSDPVSDPPAELSASPTSTHVSPPPGDVSTPNVSSSVVGSVMTDEKSED